MSAKDLISPCLSRFVATNKLKSCAKLELSCVNGKVSVNFYHDLGLIEEGPPKPNQNLPAEEVIARCQHEVQHAQKNANKCREEAEEAKATSNKVKKHEKKQ